MKLRIIPDLTSAHTSEGMRELASQTTEIAAECRVDGVKVGIEGYTVVIEAPSSALIDAAYRVAESHMPRGSHAWMFSTKKEGPSVPPLCPKCNSDQYFVHALGPADALVITRRCEGCKHEEIEP